MAYKKPPTGGDIRTRSPALGGSPESSKLSPRLLLLLGIGIARPLTPVGMYR